MAFDALMAEISLLLTEMENQPEDRHELWMQLVEKISEIRAMGMPVPDDLLKMEKELGKEFSSESEN
jgi:hypothetical protein